MIKDLSLSGEQILVAEFKHSDDLNTIETNAQIIGRLIFEQLEGPSSVLVLSESDEGSQITSTGISRALHNMHEDSSEIYIRRRTVDLEGQDTTDADINIIEEIEAANAELPENSVFDSVVLVLQKPIQEVVGYVDQGKDEPSLEDLSITG